MNTIGEDNKQGDAAMNKWLKGCVVAMLLWGASACQPTSDAPLPTLANLEAISTERAPTATATSARATLPPTFTPTATFTPEPTEPPTATFTLTPRANSSIYYIYNDDAIVAVTNDGERSELVFTFGVGRRIAQLTPSPDGKLLAFVGAADGVTSEVYVMNRDGTYLQQISCLGFADVRDPQWLGDGAQLAWYAAPTPTAAGAIYTASFVGSNLCPTANNQRAVLTFSTPLYSGFAFNRLADTLYYSEGDDLMAYDLADDTVRVAAFTRSFGANSRPQARPNADELVFMSFRRTDTGITTTARLLADTTRGAVPQPIALGALDGLQGVTYSLNGEVMLLRYPNALFWRNNRTGNLIELVSDLTQTPEAAVSPNGAQAVYSLTNAAGIMQLFVVDTATRRPRQLTRNTEGTIASPVWLDGGW